MNEVAPGKRGITAAASYDSFLFYSFERPRDHQNNTKELHKTWTHNDGEWHTYTPLSISVHLGVYPADDELPLTAEIDWMSYTAPQLAIH